MIKRKQEKVLIFKEVKFNENVLRKTSVTKVVLLKGNIVYTYINMI